METARRRLGTQDRYIPQQLQDGVRMFDYRLTNHYAEIQKSGVSVDSSRDLFLTHGDTDNLLAEFLYYAKNETGDFIRLPEALQYFKSFLEEHPTETVLVAMKPEYAPEKAGGEPNFYGKLATVLRDFSAYKTVDGKSLLYMENRMPVLEEVLGRIVVFVQNPYALGEHYYGAGGEACGMSWSSNMKAGIDFAEENHFDVDGSTKARHIANHLDDYVKILPLSEEQRKVHAYCDYTRQVTCRPCLVCPCQRQPPSLVRASGHKARGSPRP